MTNPRKRVVRVPGVDPDPQARDEALDDLTELCEKGSRHRAALGVSPEEADEAVDEAMEHVRWRKKL